MLSSREAELVAAGPLAQESSPKCWKLLASTNGSHWRFTGSPYSARITNHFGSPSEIALRGLCTLPGVKHVTRRDGRHSPDVGGHFSCARLEQTPCVCQLLVSRITGHVPYSMSLKAAGETKPTRAAYLENVWRFEIASSAIFGRSNLRDHFLERICPVDRLRNDRVVCNKCVRDQWQKVP